MFQERLEVVDRVSRVDARARKAVKRVFDVIASGCALIVLAPLMGVLWLAVRSDGGEGVFRQQRVGAGGGGFTCLKFRTMAHDAEARLQAVLSDPEIASQWAVYQKLADDPRITPVGRFLRKTNLDELPQLWNILRGEMSMVGPRPILFDQIDRYGAAIDTYVLMRPGLTGLWQVSGRHTTTFAERASLDQRYVKTWSLAGDAAILLRTVREVFFPSGA